MPTSQPKITFPESAKETKTPSLKFPDPIEEVTKRYDRQTNIIIAVLIVAFITMVVMVGTLVVDSFHFNSATYREYSSKIDIQNNLLESNKNLMELTIKNQKTIEDNQKNIEKLIGR